MHHEEALSVRHGRACDDYLSERQMAAVVWYVLHSAQHASSAFRSAGAVQVQLGEALHSLTEQKGLWSHKETSLSFESLTITSVYLRSSKQRGSSSSLFAHSGRPAEYFAVYLTLFIPTDSVRSYFPICMAGGHIVLSADLMWQCIGQKASQEGKIEVACVMPCDLQTAAVGGASALQLQLQRRAVTGRRTKLCSESRYPRLSPLHVIPQPSSRTSKSKTLPGILSETMYALSFMRPGSAQSGLSGIVPTSTYLQSPTVNQTSAAT